MKAIMVMFDSLNRHMLPPYGCDWIKAPNFERLAQKTVKFNNCFIGSMPCMPARRDLHTGRLNFLHRSWGPLEPFDNSMPQLLKFSGVHTHLVSDHMHYWEEGGANYHSKYNTWECVRGQEGDPWFGEVKDPFIPEHVVRKPGPTWRQDWVNRRHMQTEEAMPQYRTFQNGLDFIRTNADEDRWFVQIETFDPHEPFFTQEHYKKLYPHEYSGKHFDWPPYRKVQETPEEIEHIRYEYAALVSMCDHYLGKVLDLMDQYDLWKDTMLIVNTDHGFLLGEHDWWAKCASPFYNEVAHIPLFIWDPRAGKEATTCNSLVQTIDLAPTLLDFFDVAIPDDMQGVVLKDVIARDQPTREAALFGLFGAHVNCTDGRYVYMRAPVDASGRNLNNYTLMPSHMKKPFSLNELKTMEIAPPFSFTKGLSVLKIKGEAWKSTPEGASDLGNPADDQPSAAESVQLETLLFDLHNDPKQQTPIQDSEVEQMMIRHMVALMKDNDAPQEQFNRLGLYEEAYK